MDRKTVILASIGILLILLFLLAALFLGTSPEKKSDSVLLPADSGTREFSPYSFLPAIFEDKPQEVRPQSTTPQAGSNVGAGDTVVQPTFLMPTLEELLRPLRGSGGVQSFGNGTPLNGTNSGQGYVPVNTVRDGVTNPPQTNPRPNSSGIIYGGSGTDDDPYFSFDPLTGEMRIGDYQFSFAVGTIVDGNTTNSTGDPDNMVFGQAIGLTIGSLLGSPSLGLTFGTAVGSNLYPGYRLSDFGISVNNGILSFDGDEFDENFGGGGLGEEGGEGEGAGGAQQDFGGKAELTLCTCPTNLNYIWEVTESPEGKYDGSYLLEAADTAFLGGDGLVYPGEFGFIGKYEESTSGTCEDLVSLYPYECEENETDFIGTVVAEQMTCEDDEGNTYDCYVTGTSEEN